MTKFKLTKIVIDSLFSWVRRRPRWLRFFHNTQINYFVVLSIRYMLHQFSIKFQLGHCILQFVSIPHTAHMCRECITLTTAIFESIINTTIKKRKEACRKVYTNTYIVSSIFLFIGCALHILSVWPLTEYDNN